MVHVKRSLRVKYTSLCFLLFSRGNLSFCVISETTVIFTALKHTVGYYAEGSECLWGPLSNVCESRFGTLRIWTHNKMVGILLCTYYTQSSCYIHHLVRSVRKATLTSNISHSCFVFLYEVSVLVHCYHLL